MIRKTRNDIPPEEVKTILSLVFLWPLGAYLTLKYRPYWFRKAGFIAILVLYAYFISWFSASVIMAPSHTAADEKKWLETVSVEKSRIYDIKVNSINTDKASSISSGIVQVDCNLKATTPSGSVSDKYKGQSDDLACSNSRLAGSYSRYSSTSLKATGFGGDLTEEDNGKYTLQLQLDSLSKNDWEKDNLDLAKLRAEGFDKTIKLSIINMVLDSTVMAEKLVTIHYNFSDSDIAILKSHNDKYKSYVATENARKAREEAERKAKEKAKKAELERQKKINEQKQVEKSRPVPMPEEPTPPVRTPRKPSSPTTPKESNNLPLKAICKDGTISYQDTPSLPNYRGMCSGHKGIKTKLGRVP